MQRVVQLRYYGEGNQQNYPSDISAAKLYNGSIFKDYSPIVQLGIQHDSDKEINFYINGAANPIRTHPYGLFELDLTDKTAIQFLRFDITASTITNGKPLIIDIVYKE